jgi:HPt (histidine-containing phosphotransfer) domain-containing protein
MSSKMHKLASSSGVLGAREIHRCAKELEQSLSDADVSIVALTDMLAQLAAHFAALARSTAAQLAIADAEPEQPDPAARASGAGEC